MRYSAVVGVLVLPLSLLVGCGGDDEPAAAPSAPVTVDDSGRLVLALSAGSKVTVPASNGSGVMSPDTPVTLEFTSLECAPTLPGIGFDKKYRKIDLVAKDGNDVCLVSLAVTNAGQEPNYFSSRIGPKIRFAVIRTADGEEYPLTAKKYDNQGIADKSGQQLASTSDLMKPGQTKYDYAVYEVPTGATTDAVIYDPAAVK